MITIYGIAASRTYRCLWLLEELGLEYERELVRWEDEGQKSPAYLQLNPNGRVPCCDLAPFGNVSAWFEQCAGRGASQRIVEAARAEFRLTAKDN